MNKDIYKILLKIIGCLLLVLVLFTVVYSCSHFKKEMLDDDIIKNDEEIQGKTEYVKINELCEEPNCEKEWNVDFSNDKSSTFLVKRSNVEDNLVDSLTIDGNNINIPREARLDEIGILQSKYYVVSYVLNFKKVFYYMDVEFREAKTVSGILDEVHIDDVEYEYRGCSTANGEVRHIYKMSILNNGTFLSKIISSEQGTCE